MAFIFNGDFLMEDGGFAFSTDCCCKVFTCYCFRRSIMYGTQTVEQRILKYRGPEWDDDIGKFVYPDGQPCVPPGSTCTVQFVGETVKVCSCSVGYGGESVSWALMDDCNDLSSCQTVLPPP